MISVMSTQCQHDVARMFIPIMLMFITVKSLCSCHDQSDLNKPEVLMPYVN